MTTETVNCPSCQSTNVLGPYKREHDYECSPDRHIEESIDYYCTHCYRRFELVVCGEES